MLQRDYNCDGFLNEIESQRLWPEGHKDSVAKCTLHDEL